MSRPNRMASIPDWRKRGVAEGWIGRYEQELLHFLQEEITTLSESAELAILFLSLFLQAGHTCLPLDRTPEEWIELLDLDPGSESLELPDLDPGQLESCPAIGRPGDDVLFIIDKNRLYRRSEWIDEQFVAQKLTDISSENSSQYNLADSAALTRQIFPRTGEEPDYQMAAAALALTKRFLLVSGGPGTGKTTTVGRILALLTGLSDKPLRIALAAPTGKSAVRMAEAIQGAVEPLGLSEAQLEQIPNEAQTLHRLLWRFGQRSLLPPPEKRHLPYDLILVDEASMIDLKLMVQLLRHLGDETRLILLGDRNQLASVAPGSILGDICRKEKNLFRNETARLLQDLGVAGTLPAGNQGELEDSILYLTKSYRFSETSGIAAVGDAMKQMETEKAIEIFRSGSYPDLAAEPFEYTPDSFRKLFRLMEDRILSCRGKTPDEMLTNWSQSAWLTVLRNGPYGSDALNRLIEEYLIRNRVIFPRQGWYTGRPVMITKNDYALELYNGDIGVCELRRDGESVIWFPGKGESVRRVRAHRLTHFEPAYLFTVHKSQGSEFPEVTLLLPSAQTPVLTRELLYTAVTRARSRFRLLGNLELLETGAGRKTARFTGLRNKLY
ncbi:MAG: exodeoxyribonuclease V subunit alpha [Balneolaceae bacterium]